MKSLDDLPEAGFLSAVLGGSNDGGEKRPSGRNSPGRAASAEERGDGGFPCPRGSTQPSARGDAPAAGLTWEEFLKSEGVEQCGAAARPRGRGRPRKYPEVKERNAGKVSGAAQRRSPAAPGGAGADGAGPSGGKTDVRAAVDYILSLESRREYSSEEIRRKAESRFGSDAAEQALAYSVSKGYVSDGRFAKAFAGSRIAALYGRIRIVSDLRNRGIDSGLAEDVLAELAPDWRAMAHEAFRKKFRGADMSDQKARMKACRYLASRGFSSSEAYAAIGGDDFME